MFRDLRTRFDIDPEEYLVGVCVVGWWWGGCRPRNEHANHHHHRHHQNSMCNAPLIETSSAGRSHAVFYQTEDAKVGLGDGGAVRRSGRFNHRTWSGHSPLQLVIKTLSREEVAMFHSIFPQYHAVGEPHTNPFRRPRRTQSV